MGRGKFWLSGFVFSFVLIQKKQKIKALNLRRSNLFLNPKWKELASLKQLFIIRIRRMFDTRLPDTKAKPSKNYSIINQLILQLSPCPDSYRESMGFKMLIRLFCGKINIHFKNCHKTVAKIISIKKIATNCYKIYNRFQKRLQGFRRTSVDLRS